MYPGAQFKTPTTKLFREMEQLRPLPDDMFSLGDEDTACQYCGISYLLLAKYDKMCLHVDALEVKLKSMQVIKLYKCLFKVLKGICQGKGYCCETIRTTEWYSQDAKSWIGCFTLQSIITSNRIFSTGINKRKFDSGIKES